MKSFVLMSTLLLVVLGLQASKDSEAVSGFMKYVESQPGFDRLGETDQSMLANEGESQYVLTANRLTDDTIVVYVSVLKKGDAKKWVKENRERKSLLGNDRMFEEFKKEYERIDSKALECLGKHRESRIRFLKEQLGPIQ